MQNLVAMPTSSIARTCIIMYSAHVLWTHIARVFRLCFSDSKPTVPEVLKWMKDLNDWFSVGEKVGTTQCDVLYMHPHSCIGHRRRNHGTLGARAPQL